MEGVAFDQRTKVGRARAAGCWTRAIDAELAKVIAA
jgi:hypothetical protein